MTTNKPEPGEPQGATNRRQSVTTVACNSCSMSSEPHIHGPRFNSTVLDRRVEPAEPRPSEPLSPDPLDKAEQALDAAYMQWCNSLIDPASHWQAFSGGWDAGRNYSVAAAPVPVLPGIKLDLQLVEDALFMAAAVDANSERAERMRALGEKIYELKPKV